jgi:hypothetical protein
MALLCCPLTSDPSPGVRATSLNVLASLSKDPVLTDALIESGALNNITDSLSDDVGPVQVRDRCSLAAHDAAVYVHRSSCSGGALRVVHRPRCARRWRLTRWCRRWLAAAPTMHQR